MDRLNAASLFCGVAVFSFALCMLTASLSPSPMALGSFIIATIAAVLNSVLFIRTTLLYLSEAMGGQQLGEVQSGSNATEVTQSGPPAADCSRLKV